MSSDELRQQVGNRLRVTRMALGLQQNEFAGAAGIAANTFSMYESGDRLLTVEAALALCKVHKLTMDWLYRGDADALPHKVAKAVLAILDIHEARRSSRS